MALRAAAERSQPISADSAANAASARARRAFSPFELSLALGGENENPASGVAGIVGARDDPEFDQQVDALRDQLMRLAERLGQIRRGQSALRSPSSRTVDAVREGKLKPASRSRSSPSSTIRPDEPFQGVGYERAAERMGIQEMHSRTVITSASYCTTRCTISCSRNFIPVPLRQKPACAERYAPS